MIACEYQKSALKKRTHNCGELRKDQIAEKICLYGWVHRRRDHGGLIFIDLRDRYGITQIVFDPRVSDLNHQIASKLRSEWVIMIEGVVRSRGANLENKKITTGDVEICVENMQILSTSKTPPFSICDEHIEVKEDLRLKYRYLDIRRGPILDNLILRHKVMLITRNFLNNLDFIEINTPILAKSTPEGARDYLVPSRIYPGNFFALPQSPQIFKQLLMISGVDRYFQIAPCFRDEDLRADRQPEFTQIDIEMSFCTEDMIFSVFEMLMFEIFKKSLQIVIKTPFQKMKYKECMEKYGTDKPDLRFDMHFERIDDIIEQSDFSLLKEHLQKNHPIKAFCVKKGEDFSRREIDELTAFVFQFGLKGLAWMKRKENRFTSNIVKFFKEDLLNQLKKKLDVEEGDLVFIAAAEETVLNQSLDHLRRFIAKKRKLISPNTYKFVWITDFPMFSIDPETKKLKAEHHPFTSPRSEDVEYLEKNPLKAHSNAYDLVLNGYEIAGGSQRIYNQEIQKKVFKVLNLSKEDIEKKFGFFIEALSYGTPPHLGIAFGFDRLIMVLAGTDNIRDVIAFPKTQKANDLMMQAPSHVAKEHLNELNIHLKKN